MAERPNILFVITHDTGRHIGGYGLGASTPNLERLASEGVRFDQMFCSAPQCSPSRASALTGLMPHNHGLVGLTHRGFRLNDVPTTPKLLTPAGYDTWLFGFQHESPNPGPELGYAHVVPGEPQKYDCDCVTDKLLEFLDTRPQTPYFASVGFSQTHRKFSNSGDAPLDDVHVPPYLPDNAMTRRDYCDLLVDVAKVDHSVGRIMETLERTGQADNTLLIYTTDHGVAFPGAKGTLFDPGLGIACIARGPGGFNGGQVIESLTSNVDFVPTFCALAGIDAPTPCDGRSLLPLVSGRPHEVRDEVFCELTYHAGYDPMRGIRTDRYKYLRSYEYRPYWFGPNVDDGYSKQLMKDSWQFHDARPRDLLFDLHLDPNETLNLATDPAHACVLSELEERLDAYLEESSDPLRQGTYPLPAGAVVTPATNFQPPEKPER